MELRIPVNTPSNGSNRSSSPHKPFLRPLSHLRFSLLKPLAIALRYCPLLGRFPSRLSPLRWLQSTCDQLSLRAAGPASKRILDTAVGNPSWPANSVADKLNALNADRISWSEFRFQTMLVEQWQLETAPCARSTARYPPRSRRWHCGVARSTAPFLRRNPPP
ncbi:hypothetical protein Q31a_60410 [Aureliella helgolandensis]|uniref:Uncharacterized protein n=1 Tax=Aureliella helgolandensis TaxID=2527968 RepID=A0A518GGH3_9BACT|nr:hypothetical protein Q31a_60410 [Aureliella helgolandensis]